MKRFLKGLGIFLALVSVGVVSAVAVIALLLRQEEVRVPDLAGQDIVVTIETLNQLGLQLKIERREPHPTLSRDRIVSQAPTPGSALRKGRPVRVVVSAGPSELQAPYLLGEHYRKAEIMIRAAGFQAAAVTRVWSDDAQRDTVMAQDPPAGSSLEKGARISILVSSGRKKQVYVMPRLLDRGPEEAVRTTDRMGLQHRVVTKAAGEPSSPRQVIAQKPAAGHPVTADDVVEIVVNR